MDQLILVPLFTLPLLWIGAVAYVIYKDHGIVEYIDGVPYNDMISINPKLGPGKPSLREYLRKFFSRE
jgi:hypothetical protein